MRYIAIFSLAVSVSMVACRPVTVEKVRDKPDDALWIVAGGVEERDKPDDALWIVAGGVEARDKPDDALWIVAGGVEARADKPDGDAVGWLIAPPRDIEDRGENDE